MMKEVGAKERWFQRLKEAYNTATPAPSLTVGEGDITIDEAYDVQEMLIADRVAAGERVIGWKIGATSRAVMEQLGLTEPIYGCMTTGSEYSTLRPVRASRFCRVALEGEIAFVMGKDLTGPGVTTADIIRATEGIVGAVELVDCRVANWSPTTTEAIADNSLHAGIVIGPVRMSLADHDIAMEGVVFRKNGTLLASACAVEALGSPLAVVVWLANALARRGVYLRAGDIISTGSLTRFFYGEPGDVIDVAFTHLGSIQFAIDE